LAGGFGAALTRKYILQGTKPILEPDLLTWARWFQTADRHVVETWLMPEVRVSTVFLGLDHQLGTGPPLLFETMCFQKGAGVQEWRYSTWEEAEDGHKAVVAALLVLAQHAPVKHRGAALCTVCATILPAGVVYCPDHPEAQVNIMLEDSP
jgi:hypothetical protein